MGRLTPDERRRVFLAQQRAQEQMLASARATAPPAPRARAGRILKTAAVVALLGIVAVAAQVIEFHPPASLVEAFLPRR
jgi:hypothetical protein